MPHLPQPARGHAFAAQRATRRVSTEAEAIETPVRRRKPAANLAAPAIEPVSGTDMLAADATS